MNELINESIWNQLSELLTEFDCRQIATKHLESCSQKIKGYWDSRNEFYEEIYFVYLPEIELVSRAIGMNKVEKQSYRWIKLDFLLKIDDRNSKYLIDDGEIGELTLILDDTLKVVDENWSVDLESPFVVATKAKKKAIANF